MRSATSAVFAASSKREEANHRFQIFPFRPQASLLSFVTFSAKDWSKEHFFPKGFSSIFIFLAGFQSNLDFPLATQYISVRIF